MSHDLRLALRRLRRAPGFSMLAVLMLTLGIGATTTAFTLINTVFLRPPVAVAAPERVVAVYTSDHSGPRYGATSYPDLEEFRDASAGLAELAGYSLHPLSVSLGGEAFRTAGELVTRDYFHVLGLVPAAGRLLGADDPPTSVVLAHGLWQRRFGGARDILGRSIRIAGRSFTVVGIAPPGFGGSTRGIGAELWLPIESVRLLQPGDDPLAARGARSLLVLGRLDDSATLPTLAGRLATVAERLHREHPQQWTDVTGSSRVVTVLSERDARIMPAIRGPVQGFLAMLMAIATLVLLVCCANLANLLLAQGSARRRELAVRLALGGRRSRLIRQLLAEGLVIAALGGVLGVLCSVWMASLLRGLQPPIPLPVALDFSIDARILAFAVAATVSVTLVTALVPALRATRIESAEGLRVESSGIHGQGRRIGLRDLLVIGQVAGTVVVLAAAGLFLASLRAAVRIDPGFATTGVALLPVGLTAQGYDEIRGRRFYQELLSRVRALPGIEAASLARVVPLGFGGVRRGVEVEGYTPAAGEDLEFAVNAVSSDYFRTLLIPLLGGRSFDERDTDESPAVAIVGEAFARRFWAGGDAIGRRIVVDGRPRQIIGIARDVKYASLGEPPGPHYYLPWSQALELDLVVQARGAGDARDLLIPLAETARGLDPELPAEPITIDQHLGLALLPQRLGAVVLGGFGAVAVLLAALGLYGLLAYLVARRAGEIGIRIALGATAGDVRRLVVGRGLALTLVGVVLGVLGSLAGGRLIGGMLLGVTRDDPRVLGAVALLFTTVALAASWIPAARAGRTDPNIALRSE